MAFTDTLEISQTDNMAPMRLFVRQIIIRRLLYKSHVVVFLFINLLVILLNFALGPRDYLWWPWVTTGWGTFLAFHTFIYFKHGIRSLKALHMASFGILNMYMLFIDWYSDQQLTWIWIVALTWAVFLTLHLLLLDDIKRHLAEVRIFGVLISDNSGRVLIDAMNRTHPLGKQLQMGPEKIEMIPMFINAIQSFSDEINIQGCNNLEVFGTNVKVLSIKANELTLTGFISPESNPAVVRGIFEKILKQFQEKYTKEVNYFALSGNASHFEDYRPILASQIENIKVLP
jgi:hypothetical protein